MPPQIRKLLVALVLIAMSMAGTGCRECVTCPEPGVVTTPTPPPTVITPTTPPPTPAPPPPPAPNPTPTPQSPPTTTPPAPSCVYQMQQTTQHYPAQGGNGGASVTTNPQNCPWTAVPNRSWIIITSNPSGVGNGEFNYALATNNGPARSGSITAGGKTLPIEQNAAPSTPAPTCRYLIQGTQQSYTYQGGNGGFSISTDPQSCAWTTASNVAWIGNLSRSSGNGNAEITYMVAGNGGGARNGAITAAGQTLPINQGAAPGFFQSIGNWIIRDLFGN